MSGHGGGPGYDGGAGVTKVADLKPGDRLTDFFAWGCVPQGAVRVVRRDAEGYLFVRCAEGCHCLSGQTGDDGELVGCEVMS